MGEILKILLLEDSDSDADLLIRFLRKHEINLSFTRISTKADFINALNNNNYDIIIADHSLPQFTGMEAFRIIKSENRKIPFILVTGTLNENTLTEYAKEGIDDYIMKDNLLRLPSAIEHVISKKKIENLNEKLEKAYRDIKDSIYYAKTIQNAMLPDATMLNDYFPESFILFKPKDILSGDFYWLRKEENTFFIAAVDCTGHGVPGALLSMIGIEKLNKIVSEFKEPSEVLNKLNNSITVALSKSDHLGYSKDGMDMAFCSINKQTRTLNFAGANRPIWIIRKNQKEILEIKGTMKAIGGIIIPRSKNFETHEIQLKKGDTFYIFSDGFADLFGGEDNKKLTSRRLKQLLISNQDKTMNQQEEILNNFIQEWKAEREQTDDILLIGVRVD